MDDDKKMQTEDSVKLFPEDQRQGSAVTAASADSEGAAKPAAKRDIKAILIKSLVISVFMLVFGIGLVVMFYPDISNFINEKNQSRVVDSYIEAVKNYTAVDYAAYIAAARAYNEKLAGNRQEIMDTFAKTMSEDNESGEYWDLLSIEGSSVMGYVVIDSLDIKVPLYHGTGDVVLSMGAGHVQGTSLPIGGENVHAAVSAHTGLPSARFFDKIDTLKNGDTFQFYVMNEILTYQVDQIKVVLPNEVEALAIESGKDYATLVTCTPYGINSHRLLVRGERIETPPGQIPPGQTPEAVAEKEGESLERRPWFERVQSAVVAALSAVVEFVAGVIVYVAQRVMDILEIEY